MKHSKTRGATKVPNVKLRPAQAVGARARKSQASVPRVGLHDDGTAQDEVDLNAGNSPFRGVVLCATGDLDKRTLFAHAQELGAIRANDFTDQVTHLVADGPGSAKYKCALERHLPILKGSWVDEAYRTWLNGEVVDLEQTIAEHRLPIFSGVKLCLTGMDDLKLRARIHSLLAKENGVYMKSLDQTATHLLSCADGGSAKLQWAKEYNKSQRPEARIHLIWEEWFWDSIEFGGRWDEHEYEVTNARPSRKSLSQIQNTIEGDSQRNVLPSATLSQGTPLPRSLPTSDLLDDLPEHGNVNKVPEARRLFYSSVFEKRDKEKDSQSTKELKTAAGPALSHISLKSAKQNESKTRTVQNSKAQLPGADHDAASGSVLTRLANHRVASFGSASEPQCRQPFRRIFSSTFSNAANCLQASSSKDTSTPTVEVTSRLFSGYKFRAFGEARSPNLREALEAHGGRWLTEDDEDADFFIVRLVSGGMYWREGDDKERAKYRTECWLERCMFEERICAAHEHVVFTPLTLETPLIGSEKLQLSLSGLDTAEVTWVKRLIRALGCNLLPTFSRHSTHLICPSKRGAKFDKAKEWGVEVVDIQWLIEIATTGEIPTARHFLPHAAREESTLDVDIKHDVKGKGRAMENGNGEELIMDNITNSLSQESVNRHGSFSSLKFSNSKPQSPVTPVIANSIPPDASESLRPRVPPINSHPESEVTFGNPTGLLSGPSPSSTRRGVNVDHASSSPFIIRNPLSRTPSISPSRAGMSIRCCSEMEVEHDKQMTLVPSSHSPSPLKIPPKSVLATSPASETRGLRTAITALLGKRGTHDRDEADDPAQRPQGKGNKRVRYFSRAKSDLEPRRGPSPATSFSSGSPPISRLPHSEDMETIPEEGQASLRVVYDDPGQRAEKRRLIALFEGETTSDVPKPGGKHRSELGNDVGDKPTAIVEARTAAKKKPLRKNTRKLVN